MGRLARKAGCGQALGGFMTMTMQMMTDDLLVTSFAWKAKIGPLTGGWRV